MNKNLLKDIIDWDIVNWSKALSYWEKNVELQNKNLQCLELGGRKGGLSLWLSLKGNNVICSDLENPENEASSIHKKHNANVRYQAIDAANIPFQNQFDVIAFKSILGGIARNNNNALKQQVISETYKALKENGVLLFAENMESSFLHKLTRKLFVKWGAEWNYLKPEEIESLFSQFKRVQFITVGFLAAFGRNETQRRVLGKLDRIVEKFIPKKKRYILIGIARK